MEHLITQYIEQYGLIAVFIAALIEGDIILVLIGVMAHLGLMNLYIALFIAVCGCLTADTILYVAGRFSLLAIRESRIYKKVGRSVEQIVDRIGPWQIAAVRCIYGIRYATMLICGMRQLPYLRFILFDLIGCALWAALLSGLGYAGSISASLVLGGVQKVGLWLLSSLITCIVVFIIVRLLYNRSRVRPKEN